MSTRNIVIGTVALAVAVAVVIFSTILRRPEEASAPIEAIPLATSSEPAATAVSAPTAANSEEANVAPTAVATVTEEPAATAEATDDPPAPEPVIFVISQEESQVRFELDEDLAGVRTTVVGTTDQIAGELAVDFNNLATTQVGVIQINARTLATDNNFRNRSIQNRILFTNDYEFITFTPTAVNNLPDSIAIGETISFSIVGDLTIRDTTTEVTFTVEATAVSETSITGTASTVVAREAYNLQIPSVPNVANVEEEVELYIDFVANAS